MKSHISMNKRGQITFKGGAARKAFEAITGKKLPDPSSRPSQTVKSPETALKQPEITLPHSLDPMTEAATLNLTRKE